MLQNLWNFQLGSQESMNVLILIVVGSQQRDREDSQVLNNATFCTPPVTTAQCNIGTEEYPDAAIVLNYDGNDYSQGYGQIEKVWRAPTRNEILQTVLSDQDLRSLNIIDDDVG